MSLCIIFLGQGLATGTLLYVVFFEVIEKERQGNTQGIIQVTSSPLTSPLSLTYQVLSVILGFLCMLALESVELQLGLPAPVTTHNQTGDPQGLCVLQPSLLEGVTGPVTVSCREGVLAIVSPES